MAESGPTLCGGYDIACSAEARTVWDLLEPEQQAEIDQDDDRVDADGREPFLIVETWNKQADDHHAEGPQGYGEQFGKAGGHGPARSIAARDNVAVFHVQGDHDVKAEGMCRRRQEVEERFHCCAFERTVLNELTEQSGEHNGEGVDHNRCKAFPILCLWAGQADNEDTQRPEPHEEKGRETSGEASAHWVAYRADAPRYCGKQDICAKWVRGRRQSVEQVFFHTLPASEEKENQRLPGAVRRIFSMSAVVE